MAPILEKQRAGGGGISDENRKASWTNGRAVGVNLQFSEIIIAPRPSYSIFQYSFSTLATNL